MNIFNIHELDIDSAIQLDLLKYWRRQRRRQFIQLHKPKCHEWQQIRTVTKHKAWLFFLSSFKNYYLYLHLVLSGDKEKKKSKLNIWQEIKHICLRKKNETEVSIQLKVLIECRQMTTTATVTMYWANEWKCFIPIEIINFSPSNNLSKQLFVLEVLAFISAICLSVIFYMYVVKFELYIK